MTFALLIALLAAAQDPPKITIEKTGAFADLVRELASKRGTKIELHKDIEAKDITISVRDAGYFEALDALCRAHGGANYTEENNRWPRPAGFTLNAKPWVEYPASHHGDFKTMIEGFVGFRTRSVDGEGAWARARVIVFGPPGVKILGTDDNPMPVDIEAIDADGKDVRADAATQINEQTEVAVRTFRDDNTACLSLVMKPFDLSKGLRTLKGKASMTVADVADVRLNVESGQRAEISAGSLAVTTVAESRDVLGPKWRLTLKYEPKGKPVPLDRLVDFYARYDGSRHEREYLSPRIEGDLVEIEVRAPHRPAWVELQIRSNVRTLELPFEFKDVVFK